MSYEKALNAAGAKVIQFKEFGSYQGDWLALVEVEGKLQWVQGCYGSCSGCDAFEDEFGWRDLPESVGESFWDGSEYRQAAESDVEAYRVRLAEFGKTYLNGSMTQEQIEVYVRENQGWDYEAQEMIDFVRLHAIKEG